MHLASNRLRRVLAFVVKLERGIRHRHIGYPTCRGVKEDYNRQELDQNVALYVDKFDRTLVTHPSHDYTGFFLRTRESTTCRRSLVLLHDINEAQNRATLADTMSHNAVLLHSALFEKLFLDYQWLTKANPPLIDGQLPVINPFAELEAADIIREADISRIMVSRALCSTRHYRLTANIKDIRRQQIQSCSGF